MQFATWFDLYFQLMEKETGYSSEVRELTVPDLANY